MKALPRGGRRFWRGALWGLLWPRRRERIQPTVSGLLLIGLSLGIGTAAYNSASNILFIALSLLLACLVLSGVLAWLNLRRVTWRLEVEPPFRAGREVEIGLRLENGKKFLPTYALWFELAAAPVRRGVPQRPESTITGKGIDVWATLAQVNSGTSRGVAHLRDRLDPGGSERLDWTFTPASRGILQVELRGVGSLFPFGFLRKFTGTDLRQEVCVWPAPVDYAHLAQSGPRRPSGELRRVRAGTEGDMIALRRYQQGDSHRLIHWKATARSRRVLVRQFSAESLDLCSLWLETSSDTWTRPEQFELLLSLASTMAEDLFRAGRLLDVAINADPACAVRRVSDLESFLDRLSEVQPSAPPASAAKPRPSGRRNLLTFQPDGPRGVAAYLNGHKTAAA